MTPDAAAPTDDLAARLAALEAENAQLRAQLTTEDAAPAATDEPGRPGRWRAVLSALCIVIAAILVPVSIVGGWARVQLVDETRFVETFGPLADDPQVQAMIADQVTTAIDESIDLQAVTDDLFDGIAALDLPPRAVVALDLLRAPAANALTGLVDSTVNNLVQSEAFSTVWNTALVASHRALVSAASGGTANGAIDISDTGEIGVQLGPIIERVKELLVERGITLAESIPAIERTIVIAQADALVTVAVVYNIAVTVGWWLPIVAIALFVGGILLARNRPVAVLGSGLGLALGGASLATGLVVGGTVLGLSASNLGVPAGAVGAIYEMVIGAMRQTAVIAAVLGVIIAVFAWFQSRARAARQARAAVDGVNDSIRAAIAQRADVGRFGTWMYAQRVLVRVVLGVLLILWLFSIRPLSIAEVVLVLVVGLLVWWVCELVQKRPGAPEPDAEAANTVGTPAV